MQSERSGTGVNVSRPVLIGGIALAVGAVAIATVGELAWSTVLSLAVVVVGLVATEVVLQVGPPSIRRHSTLARVIVPVVLFVGLLLVAAAGS